MRNLLNTIAEIAHATGQPEMINWLNTLGYHGHITTKSRQYSTTMTALPATRAAYQRSRSDVHHDDEGTEWEYAAHGHKTAGDHLLTITAALRERESHWAAKQLVDHAEPVRP